MKYKDSLMSQVTLANAAELVADVVEEVLESGEGVQETVANAPMSRDVIYQLAQSSFQIKLGNVLKG